MVIIMMNIIEDIKNRAREKNKVIVLPESMDRRVVEAASIIINESIANVILVGNKEKVKNDFPDINVELIKFIDPNSYDLTDNFVNSLFEARKDKGMTLDEAHELVYNDYMYFACMLVKMGYADGIVSGACHSTSNTLCPALQILKTKENVNYVSSFFLMIVPNCDYGSDGVFLFADCGLEQNPDVKKLAESAGVSAASFHELTLEKPYVAMLSHSTKGSAKHDDVDKVVEATKLAKNSFPQYEIDGELQLDAAIVPEVAKLKSPDSKVAGRANVLIFPDLDAGNIGYKLVQRLAKAEAYGPICQGILKPVNDLSRGASVNDIVGVVAITAVQAD